MATVTLKGNEFHTSGQLPEVGQPAPDFSLVAADLSAKTLADFKGQRVILNIFPSVDTDTCAQSVRTFNEKASGLDNTTVLCISRDLPFAQTRFCGAEGLKNVVNLADTRDRNFGKTYGLEFTDGPLEGLLSRVVMVIDENGIVKHAQQVAEIVDEPDYNAALSVL
ncbi:thiol peroxidase [Robertkochia marina]|uniref:Thiol peroxidase n=1 Tax=Robertkochia marina TaxID=1227945 RepID=A0A4S3M0F1_9FLAO|nr:thiol peroxidase [Robertkochia marina]THD67648.1 thiol peroxidase [Robertkochia marina]TRZ43380.1 thiol peroxidase [Robertkochia marina]